MPGLNELKVESGTDSMKHPVFVASVMSPSGSMEVFASDCDSSWSGFCSFLLVFHYENLPSNIS